MERARILPFAFAIALSLAAFARGEEPAEPLLRDLPPGIFVISSTEIPRQQTKAIGRKFGGEIQRLTNSVIRLHGRSIQVNVITAADESASLGCFVSSTAGYLRVYFLAQFLPFRVRLAEV